MTQTVLTVVGYAVGTYFGYPQLGALVGAYVGAAVAAKDTVGPRINDTQTQSSSYGAAIPKTYGGNRIAGTLIWNGPMQNIEHSESSKGGPSITSYTAARSFAILIGEGPVEAIRRIWADSKLLLDYSDAADSAAQMQSGDIAELMTFYPGDEAQLPDPTIEAVEGAGDVEPYRGYAYCVFRDFPLTPFGNRIPVFTFELSNLAGVDSSETALEPLVVYEWNALGGPARQLYDGPMVYNGTLGGGNFGGFQAAADAQAAFVSGGSSEAWRVNSANATIDTGAFYTSVLPDQASFEGGAGYGDSPQYVYAMVSAFPAGQSPPWLPVYVPAGIGTNLPKGVELFFRLTGVPGVGRDHIGIRYEYPSGEPPGAPWMAYNTGSGPIGGGMSSILWGSPVLQVRALRQPTHRQFTCYPGDPCASLGDVAEVPGNSAYCLGCDGAITPNYQWEIIAGTAKQLAAIEYRDGALYQNGLGPVLLPADPHYSDALWWAERRLEAVNAGTMRGDVSSPVVVASYARREPADTTVVAAGMADLADIVRDICLATKQLESADVDVSALEGIDVLGFSRARRAPARSFLDPLRLAYFFDSVEDGDTIRFVLRGGSPVARLGSDDLAAGLDTADPERVVSERGQEDELPNSIDILYPSRAIDYQAATQKARRRVGNSEQQNGSELPVVLEDAHAAQITEILLYLSWVGRTKRTIRTTRRWAKLQPTDVIEILDGAQLIVARVEEASEQDGVIELVCVDDDPQAYRSVVAGVPPSGGGSAIVVVGPTRFELLDIPLLRQEDDSPAPYLAATGYRPEWRGARIFRSTDAGATYQTFQDVKRSAFMGHANSALGAWAGGNMVDERNTVDVEVLGIATLSSITRAQLLADGNPFALGSEESGYELAQFQRAALIAPRTYRLSGLLRGRCGTEQHMGSHAAGERFVLLDSARIYRPAFEMANVGLELLYRATSFGDLAGSEGDPFTNTAVALMPLSPVHLSVAPWPEGGFKARWTPRSRYPSPIIDSVGGPLGEASERYRVRVLDGELEVSTAVVLEPEAIVGVAADAGPAMTLETTFEGGGGANMAVVDSAGEVVGTFRSGGSVYAQAVRRWNADGTTQATSANLGEVIQAVHGDGALFVVAGIYSGLLYGSVTLSRFDYDDVTTPAATRAAAHPELLGFQGVAWDGTHIWLISQEDNALLRCNPTTLATIDTYSYGADQAFRLYAAGGWLWMNMIGPPTARLSRIDPADGSLVDQLLINGQMIGEDPARLFLVAGQLRQYDATASPPTLLSTSAASSLAGAALIDDGATLAVGEVGSDASLWGAHFWDASTGSYLGKSLNAAAAFPAGARGANLLSAWLTSGVVSSYEWQLGGLATLDLLGMTLEVCQLSEAVGPGFPATITIPGGSS